MRRLRHIDRGRGRVRLIAGVLACACAASLSGCHSAAPARPSAAAPKQRAGSGYSGSRHDATASTRDIWRVDDQPVDIVLLAPAQAGRHALIIYLPGLGESCTAGEVWRRTWAEAGYAVLCAQSPALGEAVWSSERARRGDFAGIARDAYAAPALAKRVAAVRGLIDELQRRQEAGGETPYVQIDLTRIAVGGFDLGAETALAMRERATTGRRKRRCCAESGRSRAAVRLSVGAAARAGGHQRGGRRSLRTGQNSVGAPREPAGDAGRKEVSPGSVRRSAQPVVGHAAAAGSGRGAAARRRRHRRTRAQPGRARTTRTADGPRRARPCKRCPATQRRPRPGRSSSRMSPASARRTSTRSSRTTRRPRHGWRTARNRGWEMTVIYSSSEGDDRGSARDAVSGVQM